MKNHSKTIIVALVLGLSLVAVAADTDDKKDDGSTPLVPPDFSLVHQKPKESGAKVQVTCKTANGHVYKYGEPGYDSCLSELQSETDRKFQSPHQPHPTGATPPPGPSMQFEMKIGK